jgi:hypothetical protein
MATSVNPPMFVLAINAELRAQIASDLDFPVDSELIPQRIRLVRVNVTGHNIAPPGDEIQALIMA